MNWSLISKERWGIFVGTWSLAAAAVCAVVADHHTDIDAPIVRADLSVILGRPTDRSVTLSLLAPATLEVSIKWKAEGDQVASGETPPQTLTADKPNEVELRPQATADGRYSYIVRTREPGGEWKDTCTGRFSLQRKPSQSFTFALQGDSHPERAGRMFDADLYERALRNVAADAPDFYLLMGDDFSIERLIERKSLTQTAVDAVYTNQRRYLTTAGVPIFLVNGNHEQAAKYLLDGTAHNAAVYAGRARTTLFPLPAPSEFYSGDAERVEHIGYLRDYYAWTWGDALFVVIDPYWHSDVPVDNEAGTKAPSKKDGNQDEPKRGGGKGRNRDLWQITLGDQQYKWLRETLLNSKASFKFVFSHHVLGTGRGGVEQATKYEWGGQDQRGVDRFAQQRPKWEQPIHDLMRDAGVTIFFQGHDHIYARQELDGVIYQSCPNPADPTFTAFNREAYKSGDIFSNSGHLRVTVTGGDDASCKIEYVRAARPADEAAHGKNGSIVHAYTVKPRKPNPTPAKKESSR